MNECTKVQNPRCHEFMPQTLLGGTTNGNSQNYGIDYSAHTRFPQKNGQPYLWLSMEAVLDLRNGAVSEKTPQIF